MTKDELREYLFWQKQLPLTLKNSLDVTNLIEMYFDRDNSEKKNSCINCQYGGNRNQLDCEGCNVSYSRWRKRK